ncbi:pectate lyase [Reichenbachiella carrageenanivorans]|uniref:Pectate lyase n=1 Tax=Reichenbachiella carrageenanivorans TaxID=2979869 RepID=A0ABY6D5A6_9BACT|nr:pectate lyase [Reichenbachiella carrageenanivorans]UXX81326.1 pectate lyase [Reichenbachiella carrageenanivorans]
MMSKTTSTYRFCLLLYGCLLGSSMSWAQPLAFPGAEGHGKFVTGGRGGVVIYVTNLNDDGPGSLREAIKQTGPRTILFAVSGNIELQSRLDIKSGDLTIAGQSAPGSGICIRNQQVSIKADNVIIRYIRVRLGDRSGVEADCIGAVRHKDIILDHCSFSWATDEVASFYDNENFTLQWCLITESLAESVHKKGRHGYGGIWGGKGASFHHNLLAHHTSRNPRFCGARYHKQPEREQVDFWNNVIYNWQFNTAYGGEEGNHQMVNNYFKPGPATHKSKKARIVAPSEPYGKYYVSGNVVEGDSVINADNSNGVVGDVPAEFLPLSPMWPMQEEISSAATAYPEVLAHAGASYARDDLDQRVIDEVLNGQASKGPKGDGIINTPSEAGGWPVLLSKKTLKDTDQDGMPDDWEVANGLDRKDPSDQSRADRHDYYTNLEMYLNELILKSRPHE